MVAQWGADGAARKAVMADDGRAGLAAIFKGLGSLSYGEMAGERMKLGLLIHDPEEEHDCFSDNTHNAHYYDALGIRNVYLGSYKRPDGSVVSGPSPSDLVRAKSPEADTRTRAALDATMQQMDAIVKRAVGGEAYDQMLGEGQRRRQRLARPDDPGADRPVEGIRARHRRAGAEVDPIRRLRQPR